MPSEIRNEAGQTLDEFLKAYDPSLYSSTHFAVTADFLLIAIDPDTFKLNIALVQRRNHPGIHEWALPGGFVDKGKETTKEAALRELMEETGIEASHIYLEQLPVMDALDRDPRDHVMTVPYMALIHSTELAMEAGDDAMSAEWFSIDLEISEPVVHTTAIGVIREKTITVSLKNENISIGCSLKDTQTIENGIRSSKIDILKRNKLAFDHGVILYKALQKIKKDIKSSEYLTYLLPEVFTLEQAYHIYQCLSHDIESIDEFEKIFVKQIKIFSPLTDGKLYSFNVFWEDNITNENNY